MQIVESDEHSEKAHLPIDESFKGNSNVTAERDSQ
jgi:hypothetical protein